jgi:hypothetical protein
MCVCVWMVMERDRDKGESRKNQSILFVGRAFTFLTRDSSKQC